MKSNTKDYKTILNNAVASVELEGYDLSTDQKNCCFEFLSGRIDKADFIKNILEGITV